MTAYVELRKATFRMSDQVLMDSLALLDAAGRTTHEERMVFATICDELEERHPHVVDALEAWVEDGDARSYAQVLLAAMGK